MKDFAGTWSLARRTLDAAGAETARFTGRAVFAPEGTALAYRESGALEMASGRFEANQMHVWRQDGPRICVSFADGRPFHCFATGTVTAGALHQCPPDLYRVEYDFGDWPVWRSDWTVTGPRKDYVLRSEYRRSTETGTD